MTSLSAVAERVAALIAFFERFERQDLGRLAEYYTQDAYFKDPFNEVTGIVAIERIFAHMYTQVDSPRFVVVDRVVADNGALLVWEFHFRRQRWRRAGETQVIRGASHLRFAADGKVVWHRDYWDAAEELYAGLPGIGWLLRLLQRKLAA